MRSLKSALALAILMAASAGTEAYAADRVSPYPKIVTVKGPPQATLWRIEPAVLRASTARDLDPVQLWADSIARDIPAVLSGANGSRAAYDRIIESLFEWAGADALSDVRSEDARALQARRVQGAVNAYLVIKPIADATQDIRRPAIERWIHDQARAVRAFFDGQREAGQTGATVGAGAARGYDNNLQATAGTLAMQAYLITGDASLRDWALATSKKVLDRIDAEGFTGEVRRPDLRTAEYASHETMIFLVATAVMANVNGDDSLWQYRGARAGTSGNPALLRAGLLLGEDLGANFVTKRYAARTGMPQQPYRRSFVVSNGPDGLVIPEGWLTCWMAPFLSQYRDATNTPGGARLKAAVDYYRKRRIDQFNGLVPVVATTGRSGEMTGVDRATFGK